MTHRLTTALSILLLSPAALAAPDLQVTWTAPVPVQVFTSAAYTVKVKNVGNQNANGVTLSIQLPATHTSPQVFVLGNLGAFDVRCTRANTVLNCTLGQIKKNITKSVIFNIALPVNSVPIVFSATAPLVAGENNNANNSASATASLTYVNLAVAPPRESINRHCTGTGLTSFFECELFPSSISQHRIRFVTVGQVNSIEFVDPPAPYTGDWSQPNSSSLTFRYYDDLGALVATFNGKGIAGNCYEGLTTFPGSSYVAPYEVCLQ